MQSITGSKTYDVESEIVSKTTNYPITSKTTTTYDGAYIYHNNNNTSDKDGTYYCSSDLGAIATNAQLKAAGASFWSSWDGIDHSDWDFAYSGREYTYTTTTYSYQINGITYTLPNKYVRTRHKPLVGGNKTTYSGTEYPPNSTYPVTTNITYYYYTDSDGVKHDLGEDYNDSTYTVGSDITYDVYSRDTITKGTFYVESRDESTETGKYVYYGQVSVHDWVTDDEGVPHIELVDKWLTKTFDTDQGDEYTYTETCDVYEDEVTLSYQGREKEVTTTTYYYVDEDEQEQVVGTSEVIKEFDGDHTYETNTESDGEQGPTITIDKPVTHYYYKDSSNVEHHLGTTDPGDTYIISEPVYYFIDKGDTAHDLGVLGSDTFYKTGSNYYFEDAEGDKHNLGNDLDSVTWESYAYILDTNDLQKEKLADKGINPDYIIDYVEGYMYVGKSE